MKKGTPILLAVIWLVLVATSGGIPDLTAQERGDARGHEALIQGQNIKWGPTSPKLPRGAQMAVLDGAPTTPGSPFTLRVKAPDGYSVPPHTHPTDEHLTVIQGTLMLGMGSVFDRTKLRELPAGSYAKLPKGEPHFNLYKGETIIQLHGIGPYDIVYVNPADDPSRKEAR